MNYIFKVNFLPGLFLNAKAEPYLFLDKKLKINHTPIFLLAKKLIYFFIKKTKTESSCMYEAEMYAACEKQSQMSEKDRKVDVLKIGDDISIQVFYAEKGKAQLGILAPRNLKIKKQRQSLYTSK